jgi:hypothetical protein
MTLMNCTSSLYMTLTTSHHHCTKAGGSDDFSDRTLRSALKINSTTIRSSISPLPIILALIFWFTTCDCSHIPLALLNSPVDRSTISTSTAGSRAGGSFKVSLLTYCKSNAEVQPLYARRSNASSSKRATAGPGRTSDKAA